MTSQALLPVRFDEHDGDEVHCDDDEEDNVRRDDEDVLLLPDVQLEGELKGKKQESGTGFRNTNQKQK